MQFLESNSIERNLFDYLDMPPLLGKRKRRGELKEQSSSSSEGEGVSSNTHFQALVQKHFESHFEPLEGGFTRRNHVEEIRIPQLSTDSSVGTDWEGLSEPEDGGRVSAVEVISHKTVQNGGGEEIAKTELKKFMVWRTK